MTYIVTYKSGRHNVIDAIAFTADGQIVAGVTRFDGQNDLAHIEVADEDAERLEAMLDESESVIEYRVA